LQSESRQIARYSQVIGYIFIYVIYKILMKSGKYLMDREDHN
jgi:hypothetical protein